MEHNIIVELVVKNQGDKDLYVFVYDLGPNWQVENANHETYIVVTPRNDGKQDKRTWKKLIMMLPDNMREKGHRSCKDILKVFKRNVSVLLKAPLGRLCLGLLQLRVRLC